MSVDEFLDEASAGPWKEHERWNSETGEMEVTHRSRHLGATRLIENEGVVGSPTGVGGDWDVFYWALAVLGTWFQLAFVFGIMAEDGKVSWGWFVAGPVLITAGIFLVPPLLVRLAHGLVRRFLPVEDASD